ncbi:hypothetical protein P7C70_g8511, partial [Phenoliferia sp. Uapishka_3]
MFGFNTLSGAVSAVSAFLELDRSLDSLISTATSALSSISRASHKGDDDAAAVTSFFDVDVPTSRRRPVKATSTSRRSSQPSSHPSTIIDEDGAAVSSFFDVDSAVLYRRRPASSTPRTRLSSRRSSPSSTASSSPKIIVDTSFLDSIPSDDVNALSRPPRVPRWAHDLPVPASGLQPYYFQCLPEIDNSMKKRAARKEKKC